MRKREEAKEGRREGRKELLEGRGGREGERRVNNERTEGGRKEKKEGPRSEEVRERGIQVGRKGCKHCE